jgi:hypothetical protein
MKGTTSLRAFARLQGVSHPAVVKAVRIGRLKDSIGRDLRGRPFIADVDLARREWFANASRLAKGVGRTEAVTMVTTTDGRQGASGTVAPVVVPTATLVAAQIRATDERSRKLKIENDRRGAALIPIEQAQKEAFESGRGIRERMLNIPARLSAEIAAICGREPSEVYATMDRLIREALTEAADRLEALSAAAEE